MWKSLLTILVVVFLAGCMPNNPNHNRSSAPKPLGGVQAVVVNAPLKPLQEVQACLQARGALQTKMYALGPWLDNTMKGNGVANGATGNFLPGMASTLALTSTILQMNGRVQDLVNVDSEDRLRKMQPSVIQQYLAKLAAQNGADYIVDGSWLALDISKQGSIDAQGDGIGPFGNQTEATVLAVVNIKKPGSAEIIASSKLRRSVFSTTAGVSFGRYFGGVVGTGEIGFTQQQRLQIESIDYLMMTGLFDALTQLPQGAACRSKIDTILGPPLTEAPKKQVASL